MARTARLDESLREVALDALNDTSRQTPKSDPALVKLVSLGTTLWLDTGNLEEAASLWTAEFQALTTNNTLANQVVQTGVLDDAAASDARAIRSEQPGISDADLVMELGFAINCRIALRLVRAFGSYVSVELHPAISLNVERTVDYARRYFAVCPERFIIKIPLTPEGYCAVARVRKLGIPVNYTLGFSARQNYLAALISGPSYVNVFLGRLNAVVTDNGLGDGKFVGEKASMATQVALRELRAAGRTETKLIAASMRAASQVGDLAGTDVYTMPPKVAREFVAAGHVPATITSQIGRDFPVSCADRRIDALWNIDGNIRRLSEELAARGGTTLTGNDLRKADADHATGLFHTFTADECADVRKQGKIPLLGRWAGVDVLLDDLMTQSALQSFAVDQAALDDRLAGIARAAV